MRRPAVGPCLAVALMVLAPTSLTAQVGPAAQPGPFAIDVRGATIGVPGSAEFYPPIDVSTIVPRRGFGIEIGGHVYLLRLGPARVGLGAAVMLARAAADAVQTVTTTTSTGTGATSSTSSPTVRRVEVDLRTMGPQLSFNFGSADGWSYLSAGVGAASVESKASGTTTARRESGSVGSFNVGGGARWFMSRHLGVGFDVRVHRLSAGEASGSLLATPATTLLAAAVGFSVK